MKCLNAGLEARTARAIHHREIADDLHCLRRTTPSNERFTAPYGSKHIRKAGSFAGFPAVLLRETYL
jgi:hypothetical protein